MTQHLYPRPQLVRDHWQSLNGPWQFAFDDARRYTGPTDPIEWTHQIVVPFAPEAQASGIGDPGFHTCCWYRREFDIDRGGGRVILHFGAVDFESEVGGDVGNGCQVLRGIDQQGFSAQAIAYIEKSIVG